MLILGLTGGMATGKSTVAKMFVELGAIHIDADSLSREIVAPGEPAWWAIVDRFGSVVLREDGQLDRKALAALVFSDPQKLAALNKITHPPIITLIRQRLAEAQAGGAGLVVLEAPLLYEAGLDSEVDRVVVVAAAEATQLERLVPRDRLLESEARQRMAAQMPLSEKIRRAHYCLDNNGSLEDTRRQVQQLSLILTQECVDV
ncbi:MAG: dephospho-CoA kinase [Firmicutes bacterium]|nr:dephospho-CoA kinase [Bacillota bacterium]